MRASHKARAIRILARERELVWLLFALALAAAGAIKGAPPLQNEPSKPHARLGPEIIVSSSVPGILHCEPVVAAAGDTIVVAWNDGYGGRHGSDVGTAVGWAVSRDRGQTFVLGGYLPTSEEAPVPSGADPVLMVDDSGNFLLALLNWRKEEHNLLLYEMKHGSPDKWVFRSRYSRPAGKDYLIDRPSMLMAYGRLWVTFTTQEKGTFQIALISSADRGHTWSKPTIVSSGAAAKGPSGVAAEGKSIIALWMQSPNSGLSDSHLLSKSSEIWEATSKDNGITFSPPTNVRSGKGAGTISGYVLGFAPDARALYSPSFQAMATGRNHQLAIVTDLRTSTNFEISEGVLPGEQFVSVFPAAVSSFFPALTRTSDGLAILAYCRFSETPVTDVCLSVSRSGGKPEILLVNSASTDWSAVPGDRSAPVQRNFGDYISLSDCGKFLVAVWTDGRSGFPVIYSRIIELG